MLLMRGGALLLAALLGTGCTSGNPRYDGARPITARPVSSIPIRR
jgi:hypothetical protein